MRFRAARQWLLRRRLTRVDFLLVFHSGFGLDVTVVELRGVKVSRTVTPSKNHGTRYTVERSVSGNPHQSYWTYTTLQQSICHSVSWIEWVEIFFSGGGRYSQAISWLVVSKLNLTQQKPPFSRNTTLWHEIDTEQTKASFGRPYSLRTRNRNG